jgi:hypothetical protein
VEPLFLAFLGHLVGDYIFQNDWMAAKKKEQTLPCFIHCVIWATCVVLFTGWGWPAFLALFALHFVQDRTYVIRNWMRLIGQEGFATGPYAPWSLVIIDNTFHLLQIFIVYKFLVW